MFSVTNSLAQSSGNPKPRTESTTLGECFDRWCGLQFFFPYLDALLVGECYPAPYFSSNREIPKTAYFVRGTVIEKTAGNIVAGKIGRQRRRAV